MASNQPVVPFAQPPAYGHHRPEATARCQLRRRVHLAIVATKATGPRCLGVPGVPLTEPGWQTMLSWPPNPCSDPLLLRRWFRLLGRAKCAGSALCTSCSLQHSRGATPADAQEPLLDRCRQTQLGIGDQQPGSSQATLLLLRRSLRLEGAEEMAQKPLPRFHPRRCRAPRGSQGRCFPRASA